MERRITIDKGITRLEVSEEYDGRVRKKYVVAENEELLLAREGENGYGGIWGALDADYVFIKSRKSLMPDIISSTGATVREISVGDALSWRRNHLGRISVLTLHINLKNNSYYLTVNGSDAGTVTERTADRITDSFGFRLRDIQKSIRWAAVM